MASRRKKGGKDRRNYTEDRIAVIWGTHKLSKKHAHISYEGRTKDRLTRENNLRRKSKRNRRRMPVNGRD